MIKLFNLKLLLLQYIKDFFTSTYEVLLKDLLYEYYFLSHSLRLDLLPSKDGYCLVECPHRLSDIFLKNVKSKFIATNLRLKILSYFSKKSSYYFNFLLIYLFPYYEYN